MGRAAELRRLAGAAIRRAISTPRGETRRIPTGPGRGLRIEYDEHVPLDFWAGLYEREIAGWVERLCAPGLVAYDVGSYDGYYALLMARLTGSPVLAFESDQEACRRIERNLAANASIRDRIELRRAYVAHERNPDVNAFTLDGLVADGEIPPPGVVKLDVDRAELSVLQGARETLAERWPHLIVETHSPELERDCGDLLLGLGYAPRVVSQRRFLRENRPIGHNRWLVAVGRPS